MLQDYDTSVVQPYLLFTTPGFSSPPLSSPRSDLSPPSLPDPFLYIVSRSTCCQSSFLVRDTTSNGDVDGGGIKASTRYGRRDPKCHSARRLRRVREDTGAPNEDTTCA
ncbi:hypothetical protein TNCV_2188351 [Trichonephila clavipes]|nr:hypothetical protein TNCV_2188351 [Trichonephila clavipes]